MKTHRIILMALAACFFLSLTALADTQKTSAKKNQNIIFDIQGVNDPALENVQAALKAQETSQLREINRKTLNQFKRHLTPIVQEALEPFGYFKAHINSSLSYEKKKWHIYVHIQAGPRLHFTQLVLYINGPGRSDPEFQKLTHDFPVKTGAPFNSKQYEKAKSALFELATERGYFKAKFVKSELLIDKNNYTAKVTLIFETGPRFIFGSTLFSKSPFYQRFLRRFLEYSPNTPYESKQIELSRSNLANSGYFEQVLVTPEVNKSKNRHVPIHILLKPVSKKQYTFGAGYGTDTGPRGLIGINFNWLNPGGHKLDVSLRGSQISDQLGLHYTIPGFRPYRDRYLFGAGYNHQDFDTGKSNLIFANAAYQTILAGWQLTAGLYYLVGTSEYPSLPGQPKVNAHVMYPQVILSRRVANDELDPTQGYKLNLRVAGAKKGWFSKINFIQESISIKALYTFWNRIRFIVKGAFGNTDINSIQNLPLSLQLYSGGTQSIRGYGFNQFGPGRYQLEGSFETQLRIKGKFYVVGFVDAGNSYNSITSRQLNVGVGPGIAWASPVGLLELTVGYAITADIQPGKHRKPIRIQFSMGPIL